MTLRTSLKLLSIKIMPAEPVEVHTFMNCVRTEALTPSPGTTHNCVVLDASVIHQQTDRQAGERIVTHD